MKKAFALFFCLQILSGNAFAGELMKLPELFHHYIEHEQDNHPDLTFVGFILEHYAGEHSDDSDRHCNEKLPFKHCNDCCTHTTSISSFVVSEGLCSPVTHFSEYLYQSTSETDIPVSYLNCIWQPPKVA